jgi:GAF domain-containing protein
VTSQKYADRYNKLLAMLGDLAAARSEEQIVMVFRRSARAIAGADGITMIRREGDRVHYIAEDAIGPLWSGQDFPIEACISGIAILENRPIIIPDIYADPRVPIDAYRSTFVRSMAMVPIGHSAPKWAMGAYWSLPGAPTEEAMMLLASLARAATSSFESFERKR